MRRISTEHLVASVGGRAGVVFEESFFSPNFVSIFFLIVSQYLFCNSKGRDNWKLQMKHFIINLKLRTTKRICLQKDLFIVYLPYSKDEPLIKN